MTPSGTNEPKPVRYICEHGDALRAIERIRLSPVAGLDTEFYNVDISTQSPVARSICHVWSVAIPVSGAEPNALGYTPSETFVFAADVLALPEIKAWLENPSYTKAVHNQPVDAHTLGNSGIWLRGGINTLDLARWVYPQFARGFSRPFALDNLATTLAGVGKTEGYRDLFAYEAQREYSYESWVNRCECGVLGCRKKIIGRDGVSHANKYPEQTTKIGSRKVTEYLPLTDLHPTHPLWARYLAYAARDAELALIVYQIMLRHGQKERAWPWG